jgi:hypothetical protein
MSEPAFFRDATPVTPWPAARPITDDAPSWRLPKRIGFRFAFSYFALWIFPFPLDALPSTEALGSLVTRGWSVLVTRAMHFVLHVDKPLLTDPSGSGDRTPEWTQQAIFLLLALLVAAIWSLADHRRRHYARVHQWLCVWLRFYVGATMLCYGFGKVFHAQFPFPSAWRLEQPFGDASPMGLLWTFMGYSTPYNVCTGLAEVVGGTLLFFRRTATLGALVVAAAMTNVVMLNFCYDVDVKIYSTQLLLTALFLAGPRLLVIFDVLVCGRAVSASVTRPLFSRRRLDLAARCCGIAFAAYSAMHWISFARAMSARNRAAATDGADLDGYWDVEIEVRDSKVVPYALDEHSRWRTVGMAVYKGELQLTYRRFDESSERYWCNFDRKKGTLTFKVDDKPIAIWHFDKHDAEHLALSGELDGHELALTLRKRPPREYPLVTRGFHWVNEEPYNR